MGIGTNCYSMSLSALEINCNATLVIMHFVLCVSCYLFYLYSLPRDERQRPSVGNGYLATVVHGADIFMSGVYNGVGSNSHRAAIPSTCSFGVSGIMPSPPVNKTYELNVAAGWSLADCCV